MHDVRVGLDGHERRRPRRCRTRRRGRGRCGRGRRASRARRAPSRRRAARRRSRASSSASAPRGRVPAIGRVATRRAGDRQQRLGRGADDLEVLEVEEVHVRRRVDRAQAAVDRERLDASSAPTSAATGTTWKASPAWTYSTIRATIASNCLARHVGLERRRLAARPRAAAAAAGRRSRSRDLARSSPTRARVGGVDARLVVDVGVGEDRDRVLEVVEGDEHVGEHQRHVGQAERVGVRLAERLDGAHEVVAEEADRAAGERRQARRAAPGGGARPRRRRARTGRRRRPSDPAHDACAGLQPMNE